MVWVPAPATCGLNKPTADTPGPLKVPPGIVAVICTGAAVTHNVGGAAMAVVTCGGTV